MCEWRCNSLLKDASTYQPDTLDLNSDVEAANYWFPCLHDMIEKFSRQAANSQRNQDETADERADKFKQSSQTKLAEYRSTTDQNAAVNKILGIRELLEYNDKQLHLCGFEDPWLEQKKSENELALSLFAERIKEIDEIQDVKQRWVELVRGVLAGNMFDWGAQAVANIIQNDKSFGLHGALERIQKRPWLMDDLDKFLQRCLQSDTHKCAAIFVDNSGIDVVLGILPFARELLKRGTKIILCANTTPSLNDVTTSELTTILESCMCKCSIIREACANNKLLVFGNGQKGPCLDMRTLPQDLCEAMQKYETDLLVIEGMARALHTNLYANFSCDTLKLAVVKNKWMAQRLGGETFSVICKFDPLS